MNSIIRYSFYLILILILVSYFKGAQSITSTLGGAINTILMTLQGRNAKTGQFADYPHQS